MNKFVKYLLSSTLAIFFVGANLNVVSAGGFGDKNSANTSANQDTDSIQEAAKIIKGIVFSILTLENKNYGVELEKTDIDGVILCKKIFDEDKTVLIDLDEAVSTVERMEGKQLTFSEKVGYCATLLQVFLHCQS